MKTARDEVYRDRNMTFINTPTAETAFASLPEVLQPLGEVLLEMNSTLVDAYQDFEKDFDGSKVLLVFPKLREHLQRLAGQARDLDIKPVVMQLKLNVEEVKELDAVGEQDYQDYLEEDVDVDEGAEGQPTDTDPFLGTLRKRKRGDSSPKVNPAVRLDRFPDEQIVGS